MIKVGKNSKMVKNITHSTIAKKYRKYPKESPINKYNFSPYRYALAPTSQFYFCGVPFRLDTTPKCELNCLYCFAMSRGGRRTSNKLIADINKIEKKLHQSLQEEPAELDVIGEMLRNKIPIHFGGISEPFSNQIITSISKRLLNVLSAYNYPIIISTKNTKELTKNNTLKILGKIKNLVIQISLTTSNRKITDLLEPYCPSPDNRIKSIKVLSDVGMHIIVRLQPLFFPWINEIINDLIPKLGISKCKHIIVEYLKLPVENNISGFNDMYRIIKWNAHEFYKSNGATLVGREWILPNKFKWENLQPLINAIHKSGMTYGAGDYGLNHLGDTDCCCGIDKLKGFSNWFKGNFANIIKNSKSNYVTFSEVVSHWLPSKSIKMFINSNCRFYKGNSILDFLRKKWNTPGSVNAPNTFLGISWQGDLDSEGNHVYFKERKLCLN
jgi:DNA repair photolyase